jgi:hypothetical protein
MGQVVRVANVPAGLSRALAERGARVVSGWREGARSYVFAESREEQFFARSSSDPADRRVLVHERAVRGLVQGTTSLAVPAVLASGDDWLLEEAVQERRWGEVGSLAAVVAAADEIASLRLPSLAAGRSQARLRVARRRLRLVAHPGLLADARRARSVMSSLSLPLAPGHGDFHPGNVLVAGGRVSVVDWELSGARPRGYDVLTFRASLTRADQRDELFEAAVAGLGEACRPELARLGYALLVRSIVNRLTHPQALSRDPEAARALLTLLPAERLSAGL